MASKCSSGCPTPGAHQTYGECVRSKGGRVLYANSAKGFDMTTERRWNRDLDAYRAARQEGLQPSGTSRAQVDAARAISDRSGTAYQAG